MAVSYGTYTITEVQEGSQIWTSSAAPTTPDYTFNVSHLTGDSDIPIREGDIILNSYYRYTVLSISSDGTTVLTGNRTSIRGATGAASVTYALIVSNLAIVKDKNGNLSPSTITVTAKSQTGSNAMANYTGRIKIETTTNNSTWTSRINEDAATKTYTIPSDTVAIRCSLYLKGGTTTLLDQQTVPVVSDGIDGINGTNGKDGVDGKDAYSIVLTNENHTFAGNTTSAIASEIECNVIAYKGTTQIAATIGTITGQPTGMTTSLLNNGTVNAAFRVSVTSSMVTKNGVLNVPITVDNKVFTKKFTYGLALDGEDGKDGGRWYSGTSITGTSTTATIFSGSGISSAVEGDMYLNTSTYNTYRCTLGGDASTAKWVYVNNIKGVHGDTGKGVSSIINQYYLSTSNTTQTGGSWSSTVPSYVEDCYYWTKSHIVWTDNTETDTTAVLDNGLTDANANAIDARKVATNYLSADNTGIMVADMNDGEQTPSTATGKNVFIDNDSVDIRNGQTVLSSFGNDTITLGEYGKSRLQLSSTSISGISWNGVKNFNIINGDSSYGERTIEKNNTFTNTSSESNIFNGSFTVSDSFFYFYIITATVVFSYILNGQQKTSSITLDVNDPVENETPVVWIAQGQDVTSSYILSYQLDCSMERFAPFTYLHFNANAEFTPKNTSVSFEMLDTATYSVVIETKVYQSSSYTFGSRVVNSKHGQNSFAIGEGLVASSSNQIAVGRYNNDDSEKNYAFMVGNGFYGGDRSNAFAVDWSGHAEMGDIDGYGLQLAENSQSLMDDFINCTDANDNTIFKVNKNGVVNTTGAIKAPNIILRKPSSESGDYLLCEDENRNPKFRVLNDGGVTVGALDCNGVSKFTGKMTYNGSGGLFFVKSFVYNNTSIAANGTWYRTDQTTITITNYKAIAIAGFGVWNDGGYCDIIKCYIWNEDNKDVLDVGVKNRKNAAVTVNVYVKIFYIARNVCPQ